jgi:serine/threonine protein kinase
MKQVCVYCHRVAVDHNLWCQEKECPAENSPDLFSYGEQLGDIEIVKHLVTLRTSTIYEARRGQTPILLKIAHTDDVSCKRLEREAHFLMKMRKPHPVLPLLLPAHQGKDRKTHYYGATVFRGVTRYYAVYQFVKGKTLRATLLENPEIFYKYAGWLVMSLAHAVEYRLRLQPDMLYHWAISPDTVLVRLDRDGIPRPLLLDLGMAVDKTILQADSKPHQDFVPQPYLASATITELKAGHKAADLYGLALLLQEMLAGRPPGPLNLPPAKTFHRQNLVASRQDLGEKLQNLVQDTLKNPQSKTTGSFALDLQSYFGEVPKEKQPRRITWTGVGIVVGTLLSILLLVVLILSQSI